MLKAVKYVVSENWSNLYRIYSISKYELLAEMRDSRLGVFWNFASPAIQMLTWWLVFGLAWGRKPTSVNGISVDFLSWMVVGSTAWQFVKPCMDNGCSSVYGKKNVITRMKFPVSVLPATTVCKEWFNHMCMGAIMMAVLLLCGHFPQTSWLQLLYYGLCAFALGESFALILSVLTMLVRDTRKLVVSITRMMFYFIPVIWDCVFSKSEMLTFLLKLNPCYYVVSGYRDSIFYGIGFWQRPYQTLWFWSVVCVLFVIGCGLMYRFKKQFIDLI